MKSQMVEITLKSFRRLFDGDTYFSIKTITVKADCLRWWKTRSGKGDFEITSVTKL